MKFKYIHAHDNNELEQKVNDFLATDIKIIDWKFQHVVDDLASQWGNYHYLEFACTYEEDD